MKKIILACTICGIFFTACTRGEGQADVEQTSLQINEATVPNVVTRSVSTITSGSLGLFYLAVTGYTAQSNIQYTYNSWWTTATPLVLNTSAASVCAYYPYGAAGITSATGPTSVTLTSQGYDAAQDLCYATTVSTAKSTAPKINLALNRAYAKLTFTIQHVGSYTGACAINMVSISNPGILTFNTLNMLTGVYGTAVAGSVSYNPSIASIASSGTATTAALMVPVTTAMTGNITLVLRIDDILKSITFSLSTLQAGTNYTVTLAVSDQAKLSLVGIGVTDWTNQSVPGVII